MRMPRGGRTTSGKRRATRKGKWRDHWNSPCSMAGNRPRTPTAENPLYRRTFVGREAELRQFHTAFDGAMSSQGSLAMVVGEPGIGKTSLCEQLKT